LSGNNRSAEGTSAGSSCKEFAQKLNAIQAIGENATMVLFPWLRKAQIKFARNRNSSDRFPWTLQLSAAKRLESGMRADRSNTHLAILVIELPAVRRQSRDLHSL